MEYKKILVYKWGALGDLIAGTTALRVLREAYPNAHIAVVANSLMKEICPPGSLIDELIEYNSSLLYQVKMICRVRREKYDVVINMRWMSDRCAFLTLLSGAKIRVGAGPEKLDWIYNIKAKYIHTRYHEFHRNVDIVKALGLTPTKILPYVHINNEERKIARDLFIRLELKKERTIGIHPGASRPSKAYPIERYIEVARKLQKEHNLNIFVTWGKGEEELARRLVEETGEKTYLAPSSPTIGTLAALIQQCGLYICNYSGPMNVAMAIETPLVALGATSAEDWGPFGEIHRTINKSGANDQYKSDEERYEVMKKITVDEVYELAVQRMKELYQI